MEISFNGKRALVTGATKGIGRAIAIQLVKCGAEVTAIGRSIADLESLKNTDPSIHTISADLTDWNAIRNTLEEIGPIDLLVNNAGVAVAKPLNLHSENDVDRLLDTNIKAIINVTQIVTENMLKRKVPGSIVNVSSIASLIGIGNLTVYGATKGALDAFTRAAALELGPHNIRVNCVNPTIVMTDMGQKSWTDPAKINRVVENTPLRRLAEVHEVVDAVLFLLSDKASMITGTSLPIDGGVAAV